MERSSSAKVIIAVAYVFVAVVVFDQLAYFLSYEVFYGIGARFSLSLIQIAPGFWFIPEERSLDALVELTKSLGRTSAVLLLLIVGMGLAYWLGRQSKASE